MPVHKQTKDSRPTFLRGQKISQVTRQVPHGHPADMIQRAIADPVSLTASDVLHLQRYIGNRAVGNLLAGNRRIPQASTPIQRSIVQPGLTTTPSSPVIQRLTVEGKKMAIPKLEYEDKIAIFDMMNKKEIEIVEKGGKSAYDIEYTPWEYITLKNSIGHMERFNKNVKEVHCFEGNATWVRSDQSINFGPVTSCMTITLILDDGSKLAAHDAIQCRTDDGNALETLSKMLKTVHNKVKKVRAYGVGGIWTIDLKTQKELSAEAFAMHRINHGDNEDKFKVKLKTRFSTTDVTYQDMEGEIRLESTSELYGQDIYDTVQEVIGDFDYDITCENLIAETKQKLPKADKIEEKTLYLLNVAEPNLKYYVKNTPALPARNIGGSWR